MENRKYKLKQLSESRPPLDAIQKPKELPICGKCKLPFHCSLEFSVHKNKIWKRRNPDENTWEPVVNLELVPHLWDLLELQLAKQKESGARQSLAAGNKTQFINAPKKSEDDKNSNKLLTLAKNLNDSESKSPTGNNSLSERPQRRSKTRAIELVKKWTSSGSASSTTKKTGKSALVVKRKSDETSLQETKQDIQIPRKKMKPEMTAVARKNFTTSDNVIISNSNKDTGLMKGRGLDFQNITNNNKCLANIASSTTTVPTSGGIRVAMQQLNVGQQRTLNSGVTIKKTHLTPEQKNLQLCKSVDLKVTKKVMTTEDVQQQRQQQTCQSPTSQIQIKKLQPQTQPQQTYSSFTTSTTGGAIETNIGVKAKLEVPENDTQAEDESTLCPITGILLGTSAAGTEAVATAKVDAEAMAKFVATAAGACQAITVEKQHRHDADLLQEVQMMDQQQQHPFINEAEQQLQQHLQQQQPQQQQHQQLQNIDTSLLLAGDGTPFLVTGEDGTVYQVAGKTAAGQTILVRQGCELQFVYVEASTGDENQQAMNIDASREEICAQLPIDQQQGLDQQADDVVEIQFFVKTQNPDGTIDLVAMTETELAHHQVLQQQQQQQQDQQQHLDELQQQQQHPFINEAEQQLQQHQQHQQLQDIFLLAGGVEISLMTHDDGTPFLVTDEDGTVYQVAGKTAAGQTILVPQGCELQFVYVEASNDDENQQAMNKDASMEEICVQFLIEKQQGLNGTINLVALTEPELSHYQVLRQQYEHYEDLNRNLWK